MPKVSVIIPVYKVEQYLSRCVDSVLRQMFADIEVILVDDGSPDCCPKICDNYSEQDERVVVIHKTNGGLASARNAGMRAATGEYIFFVDSDDWIDSNTRKQLVEIADNYNVDFVRYRPMYAGWPGREEGSLCNFGTEWMLHEGLYDRNMIRQLVFPHLIAGANLSLGAIVSACRSLYRRCRLTENHIEFEDEVRYSEDTIFSAKVVMAANSFYYLDGPRYYHYFYNPNSITRSFRSDRWDCYKKLIACFERDFSECDEYDFADQLWLQKLYCISSALGERRYIADIRMREKYCKMICEDGITQRACMHLDLIQGTRKLRCFFMLIKMNAWYVLARI